MNAITTKHKLYIQAKKIVLRDKNCSISYIQRKLEIGYSRTSIIVKLLMKNGVCNFENKK
jgi:S-DNA-T family DNA segregation ATPase FtsK/SpoIIIE